MKSINTSAISASSRRASSSTSACSLFYSSTLRRLYSSGLRCRTGARFQSWPPSRSSVRGTSQYLQQTPRRPMATNCTVSARCTPLTTALSATRNCARGTEASWLPIRRRSCDAASGFMIRRRGFQLSSVRFVHIKSNQIKSIYCPIKYHYKHISNNGNRKCTKK